MEITLLFQKLCFESYFSKLLSYFILQIIFIQKMKYMKITDKKKQKVFSFGNQSSSEILNDSNFLCPNIVDELFHSTQYEKLKFQSAASFQKFSDNNLSYSLQADKNIKSKVKVFILKLFRNIKQLKYELGKIKEEQEFFKNVINWQKIFQQCQRQPQKGRVSTVIDELAESMFEGKGKFKNYVEMNSTCFPPNNIRSLNTSKVFALENLEQEVKRLKYVNQIKEKQIKILKQQLQTLKEFSMKRENLLNEKLKMKEEELDVTNNSPISTTKNSICLKGNEEIVVKTNEKGNIEKSMTFGRLIRNKKILNTKELQLNEKQKVKKGYEKKRTNSFSKEKSELLEKKIINQRKRVQRVSSEKYSLGNRSGLLKYDNSEHQGLRNRHLSRNSQDQTYNRVSQKLISLESHLKKEIRLLSKA